MTELRIVNTDRAPAAIGPYSQAIVHDGLVYCSGQIPIDPASGAVLDAGVADQAELVMSNLKAVLEAAGSGLDRILKAGIFIVDMAEFQAVNEVYARHLGEHRPARATVAVVALPKGVRVEIDCVAARR